MNLGGQIDPTWRVEEGQFHLAPAPSSALAPFPAFSPSTVTGGGRRHSACPPPPLPQPSAGPQPLRRAIPGGALAVPQPLRPQCRGPGGEGPRDRSHGSAAAALLLRGGLRNLNLHNRVGGPIDHPLPPSPRKQSSTPVPTDLSSQRPVN